LQEVDFFQELPVEAQRKGSEKLHDGSLAAHCS
jgi:hypothetical protein